MPASQEITWKTGDVVRHPGKPEWGPGTVVSALATTQDGRPCQRLNIRFGRAGLKTISTAFAPLERAEGATSPPAGGGGGAGQTWLDRAEAGNPAERMGKIPEPATDPFRTPLQRLESTLALYKYQETGGSLIDWATAQSGLADPLAEFSRHDLEAFFQRFRNNLDQHLKKLVPEALRADPASVRKLAADAPPGAHPALRRLNIGR